MSGIIDVPGQRLKVHSFSGDFGMPEGMPRYESKLCKLYRSQFCKRFRNAQVPHRLESSMLTAYYPQAEPALSLTPVRASVYPHPSLSVQREPSTCSVH